MPKRFACTKQGGERPTLVECYAAAIKWVREEWGPSADGVEQEHPLRGTAPMTPEEQQWLNDWLDSHWEPELVTLDLCNAALPQRRAAAGEVEGSAFALLQKAQLLQAQLAACERALSKATVRRDKLASMVPSESAPKRARLERPAWEGTPYAKYDLDDWRREEGRIHSRRHRNELSAGKRSAGVCGWCFRD